MCHTRNTVFPFFSCKKPDIWHHFTVKSYCAVKPYTVFTVIYTVNQLTCFYRFLYSVIEPWTYFAVKFGDISKKTETVGQKKSEKQLFILPFRSASRKQSRCDKCNRNPWWGAQQADRYCFCLSILSPSNRGLAWNTTI